MMDILRREIKKQVEYCINFDGYKAGIFVSDTSKIDKIKEILEKENEANPQLQIIKYRFTKREMFVEFSNGSYIKIFRASENCRGCKFNGCIIDTNIKQEIKKCIIRPSIIPRLIKIDDSCIEFEDWSEVDKRIVEVEIIGE